MPMIPDIIYLSILFIVLLPMLIILISNKIIINSKKMVPINPKLDAYTENIKSVPDSGKYKGVLLWL